jgi:hypothetical protein
MCGMELYTNVEDGKESERMKKTKRNTNLGVVTPPYCLFAAAYTRSTSCRLCLAVAVLRVDFGWVQTRSATPSVRCRPQNAEVYP